MLRTPELEDNLMDLGLIPQSTERGLDPQCSAKAQH